MLAEESPTVRAVTHQVRRLEVSVAAGFEDFRSRHEFAAPAWDLARFGRLKQEKAGWDTVVEAAAENAPHGFIRHRSADIEATMRLSLVFNP